MMKWILTFTLMVSAGLGVTACKNDPDVLAKVEAARARNDGPPIWRVRDEDSTLYLFGAVHVLPEDYDWQRQDMQDAFDASGTIFFETARDEAARNRAEVITARDGYYSGVDRLSRHLDGYEEKLLLAATLNAGLKDGDLEMMQPWLAADMLTLAEIRKAGLKSEFGVDSVLHAQAQRRGKYIAYLETMDEHLAGTGLLPLHVQLEGLREAMHGSGDVAEQTERLNKEWARGNAAYIDREIIAPLKTRSEEYYAALFTLRNEKWTDSFADYIDTDTGTAMAVVGVGHLVGEDSVIAMLSARGYDVERYLAYRGENVIKTIDLYK